MKVVIVPCDKDGNIDVSELRKKAEEVTSPPPSSPRNPLSLT
jgi:glycine cleavage system protein P-like pyridoxal-binding family